MDNNYITNNYGKPIENDTSSLTVGELGPTLLEDSQLLQKLAHFNRERIPERVAFARGAGAFGVFECEQDMSEYTKANFLRSKGKKTDVFVRFSTFVLSKGSSEVVRDIRGFNIKFYTQEGNYDLINISLPVFYIRDAMRVPDLVHALKPSPITNLINPERTWKYFSMLPETLHAITYLYGKYGIPANYTSLEGHSVCTYKWINSNNDVNYIKYHLVPQGGAKYLSKQQAQEIQKNTSASATTNLYNRIINKDYPKWDVYVQILEEKNLDAFPFHPLDPTKVWDKETVNAIKIGTLSLNKIPENFFEYTEQVAFDPGSFVPGIEASESKLLQGMMFAYPDANRYRLGVNYPFLKVNTPINRIKNYQQDGLMDIRNMSTETNFYPNGNNSLPQVATKEQYKDGKYFIKGVVISRFKNEYNDNFEQAGELYRSYSPEEKNLLIENLTNALENVSRPVVEQMVYYFYSADTEYGSRIANNFNLNLQNIILKYDKTLN